MLNKNPRTNPNSGRASERHNIESWKDKQPKVNDLSDVVEVAQDRAAMRAARQRTLPGHRSAYTSHDCVSAVCRDQLFMAMVVDAVVDLVSAQRLVNTLEGVSSLKGWSDSSKPFTRSLSGSSLPMMSPAPTLPRPRNSVHAGRGSMSLRGTHKYTKSCSVGIDWSGDFTAEARRRCKPVLTKCRWTCAAKTRSLVVPTEGGRMTRSGFSAVPVDPRSPGISPGGSYGTCPCGRSR